MYEQRIQVFLSRTFSCSQRNPLGYCRPSANVYEVPLWSRSKVLCPPFVSTLQINRVGFTAKPINKRLPFEGSPQKLKSVQIQLSRACLSVGKTVNGAERS